ncbi:glycosyltransferase family 2 protein [Paenibacillus sp. JX-17]|uniref:Glycosyltransferase family 2 protein n=1 Tax=Paenibacillus lacisoli TaxID=3064525 RepID=A0ABT9CCK3_9BACL|nr:glycosyltransferase family 2 protein [Paenibacillus sp. JX-17]MDO7906995.1 glycosyltransferase family 2 protein [Paenibacillus sp. JX-17]
MRRRSLGYTAGLVFTSGKRSRKRSRRKVRLGEKAARRRYAAGYARGHEEGRKLGQSSFGKIFEGTSIIIPTFNKLELLKACVDSIEAYTIPPYEIIVVDNGSTDGTRDYLLRRSVSMRYCILPENKGFAGGVNHGLMMAKGSRIVVLNNDTIVTPNWLDHMLSCLDSDASIGLVGPVTNYISGEQQIDVPYQPDQIGEMLAFAQHNNKPDPGRWRETNRLVGFCFLFRREALEQVGYFDEGFRIGNYEDEDWILRMKLTGQRLMIAGDAFIHHAGSASMKTLRHDDFHRINEHNRLYFERKWEHLSAWLEGVSRHGHEAEHPRSLSAVQRYPDGIIVKGPSGQIYWLEQGVKYPLFTGSSVKETWILPFEPVRLSRYDLLVYEQGNFITVQDVQQRLELMPITFDDTFLENISNCDGQFISAGYSSVQRYYQIRSGSLCPLLSTYAAEEWRLPQRNLPTISESEYKLLQQLLSPGTPIMAPPKLSEGL